MRTLADALNGDVAVVHKAPSMLWLTSTLSTLSRLISKVRRLMKPVLWTTRMLVTSVSVVQRWNQAVAVATAPETRPPRSTPRLPVERTSSARWLNTAPSRRAAGFRRYNAPYAYPELTRTTAICAILEPKTKRRREQLSDAELIHLAPGRNQTDGSIILSPR